MRYKIFVKTLQNKILLFRVESYSIEDGFVKFLDKQSNEKKSFAISNCEIYEEKGDEDDKK